MCLRCGCFIWVFVTSFLFAENSLDKYVIGTTTWGLFADFKSVINHLTLCEFQHEIPVVYWDSGSSYYVKGYRQTENVWEYFFEPVSSLKYEINDVVHKGYWTQFKDLHQEDLDDLTRRRVYRLIRKYIRIKPDIQKKVDDFYLKNMFEKKTIGIHCRGTDRALVVGELCPVQRIIDAANRLADEKTQFLVATDDQGLFEKLNQGLKGEVIYYNASRSTATHNEWWRDEPNRAQFGEDVLIEVMLLSRCNLFFHATPSSVSACVLYFNPYLSHYHIHYGVATDVCKCSSPY